MSTMTADHGLESMPEDQFRALVDQAVRGNPEDPKTHALRVNLMAPEVVDRTHIALISMKKSVEGQLAARRADYIKERLRDRPGERSALEQRYRTWRAGALRFKSGVEEYLLTVRPPRRERSADNYYLAYETLRQAIAKHKATVLALQNDDEETDADDVLWSVLDED